MRRGGAAGGRAEFNGSIALDSTAFILNSCDPVRFLSAAFATDGLSVQFSDAQATPLYAVTADLTGTAGLGLPLDVKCILPELLRPRAAHVPAAVEAAAQRSSTSSFSRSLNSFRTAA